MQRNNRINRYVLIVAGLAFAAAVVGTVLPVRAEDQTAGVPGEWLSRYAGARTVGLGGAFVAAADGPLGAMWNPAGLSTLMQNEAHFETARFFEGTSINGVSFVVPARRFPSVGLTMLQMGSGDFERTNELNESLGDFSQSDMAFVFSAAKNVSKRFAVGANLKVVRQSVESFDGTGVGADAGVMFDVTPRVRLGASLLNIGGPSVALRDVDESYPVEFRGGASLRFFSGRGLMSVEMDQRSGLGTGLHAGTEMWVHDLLALRVGYFDSEASGGFSYQVNHNIRFDYGMSDHELGVVHRFAVSYRFGGFFASSQAQPAVFSPLGENSVTKFQIKTRTKAEPKRWRLDVWDKHDQIVRTFGGVGVPPAHVMWDGKDENGMTLADGVYRYTLVVIDEEGREVSSEQKTVEITTSGPQGSVPVIVQ
jgi:hypothetical protein